MTISDPQVNAHFQREKPMPHHINYSWRPTRVIPIM